MPEFLKCSISDNKHTLSARWSVKFLYTFVNWFKVWPRPVFGRFLQVPVSGYREDEKF